VRGRHKASDVRVANAMFTAFAEHDAERMLGLADPGISVDVGEFGERTGRGAPYEGHAGLSELLSDLATIWKDLQVTPLEYHHIGRSGLVTATLEGHSQGAMLTGSVAWVYRVRRRKVVAIQVFRCRDDALAAVEAGPA
jgi:pimeloyl-ACP methyl ester carboxylesterase